MRGIVLALAGGLALAIQLPAAGDDSHWSTRLATVPIDAAMAATVAGEGRAVAALHGRQLHITGTFAGLKGPATTAQLHEGPGKGRRGAAIAALTVTRAEAGTVSATVALTPAQIAALRAGRLYIQIQSQSAPEGNLWGWLHP